MFIIVENESLEVKLLQFNFIVINSFDLPLFLLDIAHNKSNSNSKLPAKCNERESHFKNFDYFAVILI